MSARRNERGGPILGLASVLIAAVIFFSTDRAWSTPSLTESSAASSTVTPQSSKRRPSPRRLYFYNPDGKGARAFNHPLNIFIEGGFAPFGSLRLHEFDFVEAVSNLGFVLGHPLKSLQDYGWENILKNEFVPFSGGTRAWAPNYQWHLIGGGFRHRLIKEYFVYHGHAHPDLSAWLISYAYNIVNEIIQAGIFGRDTADALVDLLVFDWVGKVLFEWDVVSEFAVDILHLSDWTYQTQWNPIGNNLINTGQLYWLRYHLFGPVSMSALTGGQTNTLLGTLGFTDESQYSFGFGFRPNRLVVDENNQPVADELRLTWTLAYSKLDNPVLVAHLVTLLRFLPSETPIREENREHTEDRATVVVNLYPGWFSFGDYDFGLTLTGNRDQFFVGISSGALPFGFALGRDLFQSPMNR
jgi:hypothetical protein